MAEETPLAMILQLRRQALRQARFVQVMAASGVLRPYGPLRLARVGRALYDWGIGFAGGMEALAVRAPNDVGLVDELGELTWTEVDERSTRLAHSLRKLGVAEGDRVALLCRNHRYFVDASTALSKLGADILYLNTAFSGPQLGEICERERPSAVIYDAEFGVLVDQAGIEVPRVVAWDDDDDEGVGSEVARVEDLVGQGARERLHPPEHATRSVILTSGTTGAPKGAARGEADIDAAVALLSKMPFRSRGTTYIVAPLFHTWGWAHLNLAMLLGSTVVLRRRFDPAECLTVISEHDVDALIVIPVMMQRILKLSEKERSGDWSGLRLVAASGSALPGDLATEWMDAFGDHLYNTYGSTEVAWATIAQPHDLREAPGTAGKAPYSTEVRIYDEQGNPVEQGGTGRIFVGNTMLFGGYTGEQPGSPASKEMIDGLMSSGDVGRLDRHGRLFVEGRDDEMIVSGGENVFPKEVEDCLARHRAVEEVAAVGVDDDDYGKRLRAFVVRSGAVEDTELKNHVKQNLAGYKSPRDIVFLEELPRNATGKVLKKDLEDYDLEGNPGSPTSAEDADAAADEDSQTPDRD